MPSTGAVNTILELFLSLRLRFLPGLLESNACGCSLLG